MRSRIDLGRAEDISAAPISNPHDTLLISEPIADVEATQSGKWITDLNQIQARSRCSPGAAVGDLSGLYGSPGAQALFRKSSNAAYKRPAEIGEGSAVLLADQRRVLATRGIPRAILPSVSSARPTAPAAPCISTGWPHFTPAAL